MPTKPLDAAAATAYGDVLRESLALNGGARCASCEVLSSSAGAWQTWSMKRDTPSYHGYRFPPEIISHAVWLYHRFGVSCRDVEDLLAQRGITVSYEAIRLWCITFGSEYARRLKRRQSRLGDIWHLDEVFVTIQGQRHYLWRAVDQDGDVLDILVQSRRDRRAATRGFRKLLKSQEVAGRHPKSMPNMLGSSSDEIAIPSLGGIRPSFRQPDSAR